MDDGPDPDEEVTLESKMNLANARKDVDDRGDPYDILKDVDDHERCSEWAIAYAMLPYNEGDTFLAMEFNKQLQIAVLQQYMDRMVELEYMEAVLQEDGSDLGYRITKKGEAYALKRRLGL